MFKTVLFLILGVFGATTRSVQIHPAGGEVIVSGTWIWPTHCVVDSTFTITDGDTIFLIWFSPRSAGGYVDLKGLRDTLVVTKDTVINR